MYYEIASKSELKPPYKTFFHEFGHAIDNLSKKGGRPFGNEAKELYEDICTELNSHCLAAASGTPVLPKDLFGGITNNQVGGGHRNEYWFNKRGKRINKISREAFAGYFEYRLTMPDLVARQAVINPYSCFTYTSQALEKMFCDLMGWPITWVFLWRPKITDSFLEFYLNLLYNNSVKNGCNLQTLNLQRRYIKPINDGGASGWY